MGELIIRGVMWLIEHAVGGLAWLVGGETLRKRARDSTRRILWVLLTIITLAVFAIGLFFAWQ